MFYTPIIVACSMFVGVLSQRSPYAGRRPIGFPVVVPEVTAQASVIGDRFGDGLNVVSRVDQNSTSASASTQKLPLEAQGDSELIRRLLRLPEDQQPFWLLNWRATEAVRKNPMMYPLRPNSFVDSSSFVRV